MSSPATLRTVDLLGALLSELDGKDLAVVDSPEFRTGAFERFRAATSALHELLLPNGADLERWVWSVERPQFDNEILGKYLLVQTAAMEDAIGEPELIRTAATLFGPSLEVLVMGEYHFPGGGGLQTTPKISAVIDIDGERDLRAATAVLYGLRGAEPTLREFGIDVEIVALECCCDDETNPPDIHAAFSRVADAAIRAAIEENGDATITETIELIFQFGSATPAEGMTLALRTAGVVFGVLV